MSDHRFYCCYLLSSLCESAVEHAYIGFTVDPKRRLRFVSHLVFERLSAVANAWTVVDSIMEKLFKGHRELPGKDPGARFDFDLPPVFAETQVSVDSLFHREMVMLVWGFPSQKAALYFEWAWQHPKEAKNIRQVLPTLRQLGPPHKIKFKIRIAFELLQLPPWNRFPLSVVFLTNKFTAYRANCPEPPFHIPCQVRLVDELPSKHQRLAAIAEDEIEPNNLQWLDCEELETVPTPSPLQDSEVWDLVNFDVSTYKAHLCFICDAEFEDPVQCLKCPSCFCSTHIVCLAAVMLRNVPMEIIPTFGECPCCHCNLTWASLLASTRADRSALSLKPSNSGVIAKGPENLQTVDLTN